MDLSSASVSPVLQKHCVTAGPTWTTAIQIIQKRIIEYLYKKMTLAYIEIL